VQMTSTTVHTPHQQDCSRSRRRMILAIFSRLQAVGQRRAPEREAAGLAHRSASHLHPSFHAERRLPRRTGSSSGALACMFPAAHAHLNPWVLF